MTSGTNRCQDYCHGDKAAFVHNKFLSDLVRVGGRRYKISFFGIRFALWQKILSLLKILDPSKLYPLPSRMNPQHLELVSLLQAMEHLVSGAEKK